MLRQHWLQSPVEPPADSIEGRDGVGCYSLLVVSKEVDEGGALEDQCCHHLHHHDPLLIYGQTL